MSPRSALVAGASGLVGGHCVTHLLNDDGYDTVITLVRRPLALQHPKLRQEVVDYENSSEFQRFVHGHDVFCCLGTTIKKAGSQEAFRRVDFTYPTEIARAASLNGAEQFLIISALGASPHASAFYSRVKGDVEAAVSALRFRAVHIFRPSLLLGDRREFRLAERAAILAVKPLSFMLAGPLKRYRPIQANAVAACMVRTAKRRLTGVHIFESDQIQEC
jgi:uncharacterized protein YbjT (DUF2867 family)